MTDELKPPPMPLPKWACEDNLGGLVPSEIRVALREWEAARDAQWLALVGELQRDAERYRWLRGCNLEKFTDIRSAFDLGDAHLDAAIDAARGEKGGV